MGCPDCESSDVRVLDSRPSAGVVRRRRECGACGFRWSTHEVRVEQIVRAPITGDAVLIIPKGGKDEGAS